MNSRFFLFLALFFARISGNSSNNDVFTHLRGLQTTTANGVQYHLDKNNDWTAGTVNDGAYTMGVTCTSTSDGTISHIRFLKPSGMTTGTRTGVLWDAADNVL